jgi:rhomboid-like protein
MMRLTPIVRNLVTINAAIFLIWFLAEQIGMPDQEFMIEYFMLFKSDYIITFRQWPEYFHPVQILTHFFSHRSFFHILFNMLALASLGPVVEMVVGSKRFLRFYLFTGLVGGLMIAFLDPSDNPVLGASGAISGVLAAFAYMNPRAGLSFFFFLPPIQAKYIAIGIAVLSFILVLVEAQGGNTGSISHFGHLAGMIAAVIYFYAERFFPQLKR